MDIPFTVKNRPDTGLYNGKLGVWLFLASEVMLFGGLFSAYVFLRTGVDSWPVGADILNVPLATLNTMFLITSSVTMVMSWASLKLNDFKKFKLYAGLTLLLACLFLVVKYFEYTAKFDHHLFPSTNNFLGIYFTMTGLHVLHVIGGIFVIYYYWRKFDHNHRTLINNIFCALFLVAIFTNWDEGIKGYETTNGLISIVLLLVALVSSRKEQFKLKTKFLILGTFFVGALGIFNFHGTGYYLFLFFGLLAIADSFIFKSNTTYESDPERFTNRIEIVGLYWHFVDLVWIFLFPVLYLL